MVDLKTNPLYYAAAGGLLLGIATSFNYILKGNVTGISGILYDVVSFNRGTSIYILAQVPSKLSIIGGMILASGIFFDIFGYATFNKFTPFGPMEQISKHTSYIGFAIAGLFVGFGSKLGNGCTSGHGLCGLPRLSIRSFLAVAIFLPTAIGIGTIKYYLTLGPLSEGFSPKIQYFHLLSANLCIVFGVIFFTVGCVIQKINNKTETEGDTKTIIRNNFISFFVGFLFGCGLLLAGMVRRLNILQFLWMGKNWNPSLLFVLGCGVLLNLLTFNYMIRIKKAPIFGQKLFNPREQVIDWKLIVGALCFGVGWGIGGICPGPAIMLFAVFQVEIHVIWLSCVFLGMFIANKLSNFNNEEQLTNSKGKVGVQKQQQNSSSIIQIEAEVKKQQSKPYQTKIEQNKKKMNFKQVEVLSPNRQQKISANLKQSQMKIYELQ